MQLQLLGPHQPDREWCAGGRELWLDVVLPTALAGLLSTETFLKG